MKIKLIENQLNMFFKMASTIIVDGEHFAGPVPHSSIVVDINRESLKCVVEALFQEEAKVYRLMQFELQERDLRIIEQHLKAEQAAEELNLA